MKKIIMISDSFKGSLSSGDICAIARESVEKFFPGCEVVGLPVADGGEGTVDCFLEACGGRSVTVGGVTGPLGETIEASYGMLDDGVRAMAGCPILLWSIDPEDWRDRDGERVAAEVTAQARDGGIILMHDIFPESVDAALEIVDALHAQGYLFCTVEELFAARGVPLEAGQVYWNAYP